NSTHGLGDINVQSFVTVNGVAGHTTLVLNDRAGIAGGLIVQDFLANQGFRKIAFANIGNLIVDAQSACTYEVDVVSTPDGMKTTVNAGGGGDIVHINGILGGTLTGIANSVLGPVEVNGGNTTLVTIFDQTTATDATYTLGGNTITRTGGFSLTYS